MRYADDQEHPLPNEQRDARSTAAPAATRPRLRGLLQKHGLEYVPANRPAIDAETGAE